MAQDIGDVFKAHATVDHLGSGSMAEDMAREARRDGEARVGERLLDHPPHRTFRQRLERGPTAQKDLATRTRRSPALHVGHHGLAHVVRQGDAARPARLAGPQVSASVGPIDIVQAERDDVLRAEAKTREQEEHSAIAQTAGGVIVVHRQHALHFLGREP